MNGLALEQRIKRFQETFLKEENFQLSREGQVQLGSLLYDSNYRFYQENVYVRTHDNQAVDIFFEQNLKTGGLGFSYTQISNVGQIQEFVNAVRNRQQPLVYNSDAFIAGSVCGLSGLLVGTVACAVLLNPLPLLIALPSAGCGAFLGQVGSKKDYEKNLVHKKKSDADFDAKYYLITGKDAILKALIPEYHPE